MTARNARLIAVQSITLSRAAAAIVFASIALIPGAETWSFVVFGYATVSDIADGLAARALGVVTSGGGALDIACDKYLTLFSLLFAVSAGAPLVPCCLSLSRDILVQAFRQIRINGRPLFTPIRALGVAVVAPIRFTTAFILVLRATAVPVPGDHTVAALCWLCAGMSFAVLVITVRRDWPMLKLAFV